MSSSWVIWENSKTRWPLEKEHEKSWASTYCDSISQSSRGVTTALSATVMQQGLATTAHQGSQSHCQFPHHIFGPTSRCNQSASLARAEYSPVRAQRILSKRILGFNMRSSSPHDPPCQTVLKWHTPSILNAGKIWNQRLCDSTAFTPPSMTLEDYTQLQTAFKWEINSHPFQLWASDGDKRVLCSNQVSVKQNTDVFKSKSCTGLSAWPRERGIYSQHALHYHIRAL